MAKKTYPYFAVNTSATKAPAPKWLYRNAGSAKVSKTSWVHADQYAVRHDSGVDIARDTRSVIGQRRGRTADHEEIRHQASAG